MHNYLDNTMGNKGMTKGVPIIILEGVKSRAAELVLYAAENAFGRHETQVAVMHNSDFSDMSTHMQQSIQQQPKIEEVLA